MNSTERLASYHLRLSESTFDDVHLADVKNQVIDALSRLQTAGEDDAPL